MSETAEHVFFIYLRYDDLRDSLEKVIEYQITPDNIVGMMVAVGRKSYLVSAFI